MARKNKKRKFKILFTGGGSGGHIFPLVAIIREIKRIDKDNNFTLYYSGPRESLAMNYLAKEGVKMRFTLGGKIRPYFSWLNFIDILVRIPISFFLSFFYIFFISPDAVFSKGGYGSFPLVFWSTLFQSPLFVHESDSVMGRANRFGARWALEVFTSFPEPKTNESHHINVGNPIRIDLLPGDKQSARKALGILSSKPVIFIVGGSQGARSINDSTVDVLQPLLEQFEVIHQCGEKNFNEVRLTAKIAIEDRFWQSYHPYPFLDDWETSNAYHAADLVVSRAGAGTIFEIAAFGKPSIIVPMAKSASDHQIKNAYIFEPYGAQVIEENNFTPQFFLKSVQHAFDEKDSLKRRGEAALLFSRPRSARVIAEYIMSYLTLK
jgi:UDP-N-acetylglucosamine--N-acetylmuramyl-(pentapeptide) pyrophosphoryl-undecaprenol N-acetylglucosamine transferase